MKPQRGREPIKIRCEWGRVRTVDYCESMETRRFKLYPEKPGKGRNNADPWKRMTFCVTHAFEMGLEWEAGR